MKRSNRFIIGLLATALTFGSLSLTGPPPGFAHRGHHFDRENCGTHRYEKQQDRSGQNQDTAPTARPPAKDQ